MGSFESNSFNHFPYLSFSTFNDAKESNAPWREKEKEGVAADSSLFSFKSRSVSAVFCCYSRSERGGTKMNERVGRWEKSKTNISGGEERVQTKQRERTGLEKQAGEERMKELRSKALVLQQFSLKRRGGGGGRGATRTWTPGYIKGETLRSFPCKKYSVSLRGSPLPPSPPFHEAVQYVCELPKETITDGRMDRGRGKKKQWSQMSRVSSASYPVCANGEEGR